MSNALRKKKKMKPLGFNDTELKYMQNVSKKQTLSKDITIRMSTTLHDICIYVLHAKFGYGKVRLARYMEYLQKCAGMHATGKMKKDVLFNQIRDNAGIDLTEEYRKVPFKEMLVIAGQGHPRRFEDAENIGVDMRWSYESYMTMCIDTLIKLKIPKSNIPRFIYEMNYVINSFWRRDCDRVDISILMVEEVGKTFVLF